MVVGCDGGSCQVEGDVKWKEMSLSPGKCFFLWLQALLGKCELDEGLMSILGGVVYLGVSGYPI